MTPLLALAAAALLTAPLGVTGASVQVRIRVESRDDRYFRQYQWGDKDIFTEWRLRGRLTLEQGRARLDAELQDQRVVGAGTPVWLDTAPMAGAGASSPDAGLRVAGKLAYRTQAGRVAVGRFPAEAAGGVLLGADEAGLGYRPFAASFETARGTVWTGVHARDDIVGPTWVALAKHRWMSGCRDGEMSSCVEAGILGRRVPSRPIFAGVHELVATPYIHVTWSPHPRDASSPTRPPLTLEATAALQWGTRAYRPVSDVYRKGSLLEGDHGISRFTVYYRGDGGQRTVLAGFGRSAAHVRIPVATGPVFSLTAHWAQAGGGPTIDRNFIPFTFDTNRFFGAAGYFGERNTRAGSAALAVPLKNGWSLRAAVWRADVDHPETGLRLENGDLLEPAVYTAARRAAARSRFAISEWDAEARWQPAFLPLALRFMYSEMREGAYVREMIRAGEPFFAPPAQFAALQATYEIGSR